MRYDLAGKTILVTGAAGFIGSHLAQRILDTIPAVRVVGIDNMNPYYDVALKQHRLSALRKHERFVCIEGNIADPASLSQCFARYAPDIVIHLAAQAGVRHSISCPEAYIESNLVGFFNMLEACRHSYHGGASGVLHLIYASSSSVYGNQKGPQRTSDPVDRPVSLYAATKKSNELMAHAYGKLYGIPTTGLRFFTVYGPAGRPDMAYFTFAHKLVRGKPIQLFGYGELYRDFTYIDDIVTGVMTLLGQPPEGAGDTVPYRVYNMGNRRPQSLMTFVDTLEKCLMREGLIDKPGTRELLPMQPGDVYSTHADIEDLVRDFGFAPSTSLEDGLTQFVKWYGAYYGKEKTR